MAEVLLTLAAVAFLLGACASVPGADGRYATPGRGGWAASEPRCPRSPFRWAWPGAANECRETRSRGGHLWVGAEITGRPQYKKINLQRMRQAALARSRAG